MAKRLKVAGIKGKVRMGFTGLDVVYVHHGTRLRSSTATTALRPVTLQYVHSNGTPFITKKKLFTIHVAIEPRDRDGFYLLRLWHFPFDSLKKCVGYPAFLILALFRLSMLSLIFKTSFSVIVCPTALLGHPCVGFTDPERIISVARVKAPLMVLHDSTNSSVTIIVVPS